jgi:hypothetical protein
LGNTIHATDPDFRQLIVRYTWSGDYNLDGVVDGLDYSIVQSNLGTSTPGGVAGWQIGDGNFDGIIDDTDYGYIDAQFGEGGL